MVNAPQNPNIRRQRHTLRAPLTLFVVGTVALWFLLALLGLQVFSYSDDLWQTMVNNPERVFGMVGLMVPGTVAAFLLWVGWIAGRKW